MKIFTKSVFFYFTFLLLSTASVQAAIELAIETNPGPAQPNEPVDVQITVGNSGNSLSGNLVLQMIFPEHLNQIADGLGLDGGDCPSSYCETNEIVTWTVGVLPPGFSRAVSMPPIVTAGTVTGTSIPFFVEVFENNVKVGDFTRNVTVQSSAPFDIAVDEDVNPVATGNLLVYTISYSNRSATNSTNTSLSFPLPSGVSFVSATNGGVLNGNSVEWNLNTLPSHTGSEQKVTVSVDSSVVSGSFLEIDNAEISGTVNFQPESSSALAITSVNNISSMILAMEINPNPVKPGETLNTAMTISNTTAGVLSGVVLDLRFPDHLNQIADGLGLDGGNCPSSYCETNEFVTWQLGSIPPGSSQTVTLPPIVSNTIEGSLITFNARVREDNGTRVAQSRTVLVQHSSPFEIVIDEDVNPVKPGDTLVYTVNYSNRSSASSTNTTLSFPLPLGVSFVSATGNGQLNGNTVEWNLNTLPAHTGSEHKVTVTVNNSTTPGSVLEVDKAKIEGTINFFQETASALSVATVTTSTSMILAIEANPDPVQPGETLKTALTVTNTTNGVLFGVDVELRYPEHLNQIADGAGLDGGGCPSSYCETNEIITWQLGAILPGSSHTVTLPPIVTSGTTAGSLITYNARGREDNGTQVDQNRTVLVQHTPPFDIAVDEDINPVEPGDPLVYTITYSNRSSASANNTTLSFPLPAGVNFIAATGGGVLNGNIVEWNLNTIPAHTGAEQKVAVTVGNTVIPGSVLEVDKAEIKGTINFLDESANALATTAVNATSEMILSIDLDPDPVLPNQTLNATFTVSNPTNSSLFGVVLELRYPEHVNQIADGSGIDEGDCPSSYCETSEIITWQLGTMAANSSQVVTLPAIVTNNTLNGTLITFNASVFNGNNAQVLASNTGYIGNNFTPAPSFPICGDVNGDGSVTNTDAILIQRHVVGLPPGVNQAFCDVNGDGQCTNTDAIIIQRSVVGLPPGIQQTCVGVTG